MDTFEGEDIWIEGEFLKHDDLPAVTLRKAMESFSIMRSERAILTPHNAFNTREALDRTIWVKKIRADDSNRIDKEERFHKGEIICYNRIYIKNK